MGLTQKETRAKPRYLSTNATPDRLDQCELAHEGESDQITQ